MTKYQWTDWITHVPGQQLPNGTHALFEFHGLYRNGGNPYEKEGTVTAAQKDHACWHATHPGDRKGCMIIRYKLRSVADELETTRSRELETTNG